jgi:polysaccharide export outer membrane protein
MMQPRLAATLWAVSLLLVFRVAMSHAAAAAAPAEDRHMSALGPGDSVSIQIFGQPDITNIYVGDDGTLNVPLAGPVPVGGSSPVEAAQRVAKALKAGGYFVDPHVTILVTQSRSQLVSVLGEVQTAGRYVITPRTTVVDLLAQAGGVKDTAAEVGYLLRPNASGRVDRITVSLNGISTAQGAVPNQTLMGGDSLVVPRAEHFFVYGEVTTPGMYRLEPNMSVMQAIARAGGVTARGSERRIQVKRQGKDGQIKIFKPKAVDPVQADDIIQVKESIF